MIDPTDLRGLIHSYAEGDVLARKVLIDLLSEEGDPRAEQVRDEGIDWDGVAANLARVMHSTPKWVRWLIDCARVGSVAPEEVVQRVRRERRLWLEGLFPEVKG